MRNLLIILILINFMLTPAMAATDLKTKAAKSDQAPDNNEHHAKSVQRIIALSPHAVELLYTLGAGDRIVGASEFADFPKQATLIPRVGGYNGFNIERIIELEPDLLILWDNGKSKIDSTRLEQLGIRTYRSEPQNLDAIADELEHLGSMLDMENQGHIAATQFRQRLQNLRTTYQHREPVSFFYQIWANPLKGMSSSSWVNEVIEGCGGRNILTNADVNYPNVSVENVLVLAPQAIIQPSQHGSDQWRALDWQKWTEIPAVANHHVFEIDGNTLHRFSTRILDGMETVCRHLDEVRNTHQNN